MGLQRKDARVQLTYEVVEIADSEKMGLAGVHYLLDMTPEWYVGASGFGAVYGERGGFFTGGFSAGTQQDLGGEWYLDAGLFLGGGGGGAAPQGSGLMLRPHLMLGYRLEDFSLQGGVTYVEFPDGNISSSQLSFGFNVPFGLYYAHAEAAGVVLPGEVLRGLERSDGEWLVTVATYSPDSDTLTTAGTDMASLDRIGFEYRHFGGGDNYFFVETGGALGGGSDGFAELLAGVGYRLRLSEQTGIRAALSLGGAGGGQVDTEGGLVGKLRLGFDYGLGSSLRLGVEAGRMESAGSFAAGFYGLNLGVRLDEISDGVAGQQWIGEGLQLNRWRLLAVQHTNLDAARKSGTEQDLGLVGLKIERFISSNAYLSGQAYGGWHGDAGGYAVGLVGAGAEWPLTQDNGLKLNLELAAGAAGGGGVDVAGGAVVQPTVGLTWALTKAVGVRVEGGRITSLEGELDSPLWGVGLTYAFSRP